MDVYFDDNDTPSLLLFTAGTTRAGEYEIVTGAIDTAYTQLENADAKNVTVSWDLRNADAPALMLPRLIVCVTQKFMEWNSRVLPRVKRTKLLITSEYIRSAFVFALTMHPQAQFELVESAEELLAV